MNMFKATKAKTVKEYFAALPEDRKEAFTFLHNFIQKAVPKLKAHFANNMIGFGSFPFKNSKKETMQWPVIGLANKKQYISLYVCSISGGIYVAEKYKKDLGNVKVGNSCISLKKIEDVNLPILKKILKEAERSPGLS